MKAATAATVLLVKTPAGDLYFNLRTRRWKLYEARKCNGPSGVRTAVWKAEAGLPTEGLAGNHPTVQALLKAAATFQGRDRLFIYPRRDIFSSW